MRFITKLFSMAALIFASAGLMADPVAKVGETEYDTLADAISAVPTDGTETTITLVADVTINAELSVLEGRNVLLNLGNCTITKPSTLAHNKAVFSVNNALLTIVGGENGRIDASLKGTGGGVNKAIYANGNSVVTIRSGRISGYESSVMVEGMASLNVSGGTLDGANGSSSVFIRSTAVSTISGGTVDGVFNGGYPSSTDGVNSNSVLNITGGIVKHKQISGVYSTPVNNYGILNVTGGTLSNEGYTGYKSCQAIIQNYGRLSVSGTAVLKSTDGTPCVYNRTAQKSYRYDGVTGVQSYSKQTYVGTTALSGGAYSTTGASILSNTTGCSFVVSGGLYSAEISEEFLDADSALVANADAATKATYPYTVARMIVQVISQDGATTNKYASLQTAIAAAQANDVIEILAESVDIPVVSKENITIQGAVNDQGVPTTQVKSTVWDPEGPHNVGVTYKNLVFLQKFQMYGDNTTIRNCRFVGRDGMRFCYAMGPMLIEDCVFDTEVYGIHFDEVHAPVTVKNCTMVGFNTYGVDMALTFDGCHFVDSTKNPYYVCQFWGTGSVIKNCDFSAKWCTVNDDQTVGIANGDGTVELLDCTVATGTLVDLCGNSARTGVVAIDAVKNAEGKFVDGTFVTGDASKINVADGKIAKLVSDDVDDVWHLKDIEIHVDVETEPVTREEVVESAAPLSEEQQAKAASEVETIKTNLVVALVDPVVASADTGIKGTVTEESKQEIVKALEKNAAEQGLTEAAKEQIQKNIDEFLDETSESNSSSNFLNIAVQAVDTKIVASDTTVASVAAKATVVVYEVKPIIETVVSNTVAGVTEVKVVTAIIPNETVKELAEQGRPMTFNLPIEDPKATCATVKHVSAEPDKYPTETFTCPVWEQGGKRYITISVAHFSTFEVSTSGAVLVDSDETIGITKLDRMTAGFVSFGVPYTKSGVTTETQATLGQLLVTGVQAGEYGRSWVPGKDDFNNYNSVKLDEAVKPGQPFWYERKADSAVPLTLAGYTKETLVTTGAASTTDRPGLSHFANPKKEAFDALAVLTSTPADGDVIVLEGDTTRYFYAGGWKKKVSGAVLKTAGNVTVRGVPTEEAVTSIPVAKGRTFWYITKTSVSSVQW